MFVGVQIMPIGQAAGAMIVAGVSAETGTANIKALVFGP